MNIIYLRTQNQSAFTDQHKPKQPAEIAKENEQEKQKAKEEKKKNTVNLTQQDEENIAELMNLGFSREVVLENYLKCGKNKDYTANFLIDSFYN